MTNKWFRVIKIASTVLSVGSTLLTAWVDEKATNKQIRKEVIKAAAKIKQKES